MLDTHQEFYTSVTEQLKKGATRAALGLLGFRSDALREHLRELLQGSPGAENAFLADLVFEATFGWKPADITFGGLSKKLLHPELVNAMRKPPSSFAEEYAFPARRRPYTHQLKAWKELIENTPPRSVLVSSGTGSGKTECFLVPILNDLATELTERPGNLVGVRALFLYPLNALIKSQRDRLIAWSEPFKGRMRFCLFNGDTPREARPVWQSEIPDRRTLRNSPSPILVTNATMLEYMLVRSEDRPIIENSQGKLRWIVIDEAHTYIGSQAAELTLLLRRVLHAFGCSPDQVHFVATSATIAREGGDSTKQLQEFLADVAGVNPDRVSLVHGERIEPVLPDSQRGAVQHPLDLGELRKMESEQLFNSLAAYPNVREMRAMLIKQPSLLSKISYVLFRDESVTSLHRSITLLDLCTRARNARNEPFLSLRGHIFQRALNGVWACTNIACAGRKKTKLENTDWPFGKIFLERRTKCNVCGCAVFEIVQCIECGDVQLAAIEVNDRKDDFLRQFVYPQDEDEFQQELDPLDEDEHEDEGTEAEDLESGFRRLLVGPNAGNPVGLLPEGRLDWSQKYGNIVNILAPDQDNRLQCPCCLSRERGRNLFSPIRLGAPFLLQTAISILLRHLPAFKKNHDPLPSEGRRLLSFTDSRQGTARFAAKLQLETERNFVRSILYHSVFDQARPADEQKVKSLKREIETLEPLVNGNPVLLTILEQKRRELADIESPPLGRLPWSNAADRLLADDSFKRWLLPPLQNQTFGLNDRQLTELCLWREFMRRPKRQFSLEGLGLLGLGYPQLQQISRVPSVAAQREITLDEWHSLIHVTMDFQLRGRLSVAIPHDYLRWLGYPGKPSVAIAPNQNRTQRIQLSWPSTRTALTRRARLVRLIACALDLDLDDRSNQTVIEELLIELWSAINPLLNRTEQGYHLELGRQAEIVQVAEAWFCPVTRRLLTVTFKGITPYLPQHPSKELAECSKFIMPVLPEPYWLESGSDAAGHWLETNKNINRLRKLGAWTDICDRIASFTPYFYTAEHSAQIPGATLTHRENEFKKGKINILSCSTTMELGVDIGGLTTVAMNNVPPHPVNFLQRAGRAGRRGETTSTSFTLCKSTPHGEAVFRNPLWPFTTKLSVPRVSLQSRPIVQRHINSLVLSAFLNRHTHDNILRLYCGWFFESDNEGESAPWLSFREWCRSAAASDKELTSGINRLVRRTVLDGTPVQSLLNPTLEMMEHCAKGWLSECQSLLENLDIVQTREGNSRAEKAVGFQLQRIRREYLLGELASRGFLPIYGFATGVACLVTTTIEQIEQRRTRNMHTREDNRAVRAGYPSRALPIAIRDYAPGTDTVLDGRVYRSGGLTLNWQLPAELEGPPEVQSLRWAWRCRTCGGNGNRFSRPSACPHCGERKTQQLDRFEYIQPAGFAVNIRWIPHNDITIPQYIPVRDPLISLEGADWLALPTPTLGRYRFSSHGTLFHRTDGLHGEGFAVCLRCGMADSMFPTGRLPSAFADEKGQPRPHKRLRGGRDNDRETECPGSHEQWAIKPNLRLGASTRTDIFELQLNHPNGQPIDRVLAYTLGVALRRALARRLGIEDREIGSIVTPSRDANEHPVSSIHLFDTAQGGAGYVAQTLYKLPDLIRDAKHVLECPRNCDVACQACLLTFDTQYHLDLLDRISALSLLNDPYLNAFDLPTELQAFGDITRLEMEPLTLALRRELQLLDTKEIRVHLGGQPDDWEPLDWRLRNELLRLREIGCEIHIIVPANILKQLLPSQRDELAALMALFGTNILCHKTTPVLSKTNKKLSLILEIGGERQSIKWATSIPEATAPTPHWGSGLDGAQFVRGTFDQPLDQFPIDWLSSAPEELRKPNRDLFSITITDNLDGPLKSFGNRAWRLILDKAPELNKLLNGEYPLTVVEYNDRYLRSPLVLMLLKQLLGSLTDYTGGVKDTTVISIQNSLLRRNDTRQSHYVHHDWRDAGDRRQVFESVFSSIGRVHLKEKPVPELPHARELHLSWQDRTVWTIRLDQGVGYWHAKRTNESFPFNQPMEHQIKFLGNLDIDIQAGSRTYPTYWYVGAKK